MSSTWRAGPYISFAGHTLRNVEVRAAGAPDVVIGPLAELAVPSSGNWTVLAISPPTARRR